MKFSETLTADRILVGGKARDLTQACTQLVETLGVLPQDPEASRGSGPGVGHG